jgi:hypothetical protein
MAEIKLFGRFKFSRIHGKNRYIQPEVTSEGKKTSEISKAFFT